MASWPLSRRVWLRGRPGEIMRVPSIVSLGCHQFGPLYSSIRAISSVPTCEASVDGRARLSRLWIPTGGIAATSDEDSHSKLIRAGFLRQAHPGIFHMLPLGRRVQDKLEALVDKYMFQLSASKLALSSISSEELWSKSGRLANASSELFHFSDRKDVKYLLSPTHEEEITSLVSSTVKSYKELPVRLYQISRKYRDELRPRHGLLRSREFIMKDLYTFDHSSSLALGTYHQVREVYARLFDELKLPYLVAEADSGDMGGNLSHEFHFPTSKGEDHVISCSACNYIANEELAESRVTQRLSENGDIKSPLADVIDVRVWRGISRDRLTLINVWYRSPGSPADTPPLGTESEINIHAIKTTLPYVDASIDDPVQLWIRQSLPSLDPEQNGTPIHRPQRLVNLLDCKLPSSVQASLESKDCQLPLFPAPLSEPLRNIPIEFLHQDPSTNQPLNLVRIRDGDPCPRCIDGSLKVQKAIELGHTFHLGTRYSEPLGATVVAPGDSTMDTANAASNTKTGTSQSTRLVPMQMGCHGIGVSRIVGAVADTLADERGLNWPRVMAPFEVVIVPSKGKDTAALEVYDMLRQVSSGPEDYQLDLVLDDRSQSFPWKMQDADLVGYPVIVVVGRRWDAEQICEVQCRRLQVRQNIPVGGLGLYINSLLSQL